MKPSSVPTERIARAIVVLRGHKVMLDADLAALYGVETRTLNQAVKRNFERFPGDFMFQLTWEEAEVLRSQSVTLNAASTAGPRSQSVTLKRGMNVKYLPYAFTEQGVAMLSSVLRSNQAVQVNIEIMRAFVRMREVLATHKDLARRVDQLEARMDAKFRVVFEAIRELMTPPQPKKRPIGFVTAPDK